MCLQASFHRHEKAVYLPNPTWPNHAPIFTSVHTHTHTHKHTHTHTHTHTCTCTHSHTLIGTHTHSQAQMIKHSHVLVCMHKGMDTNKQICRIHTHAHILALYPRSSTHMYVHSYTCSTSLPQCGRIGMSSVHLLQQRHSPL